MLSPSVQPPTDQAAGFTHHAVCKHRPPLKGTVTERERKSKGEREMHTHKSELGKKVRETEVEFERDMKRDSYI